MSPSSNGWGDRGRHRNPGAATSPSASDATYATQIGASGNGATIMQASSRVAFVAVWDVAVGPGALASLFDAMRGRFGL